MERILVVNFPAKSKMVGTGRFIQNLGSVLNPEKYVLDIMLYHGITPYYEQYFTNTGSIIYEMPYYVSHPVKFLKEIFDFYKKHDEYKIIYCQASHASVILYTLPIWKNKKKIILCHSHNSDSNHLFFHRLLSRIIVKRCDYLFACSEKAAKFMYGKKETRYTVIKNGINLSDYRFDINKRNNIRREYKLEDTIVIGHVGAFRKQKNHEFLIDIYNEFQKICSNSKLVLVGDGELKDQIIEKIDKYQLNDKVILTGNVEAPQNFYQMFDIFLLPSFYEGLPFVGIEAQASGTFCLFSDEIDKEVALTPLAHFFSLKKCAKDWAEFLVENLGNLDKKDYTNMMEKKGYGIKNLELFYNEFFDKLFQEM